MHPELAPAGTNLSEWLQFHAARQPDQVAFRFLARGETETASITYAGLDGKARRIAAALTRRGLERRCVLLVYPTCIECVAALMGCFYAGAIAVPAPAAGHGRAGERLRGIARDARADVILTLASETGLEAAVGLDGTEIIATDTLAGENAAFAPQALAPDAIAVLQYTSGSTGNPRAVMLTHANLAHQQAALAHALGTTWRDTGVCWVPLYHDMGLVGGVLHAIYLGGTCVLMPPMSFLQRPARWLRAISRYQASVSMAPSFAYELAAARFPAQGEALALSAWRVALSGGEVVRPAALRAFAERFSPFGFNPGALMPAYGLAEATLMVTASATGGGLVTAPGPSGPRAVCGLPPPGHEIMIADAAASLAVPEGEVGEIWVRGPSVAAGYWNQGPEGQAAFEARLADAADGPAWLRTGDLGYVGPHGLVVTGRRKELIVIRGANLDPTDIESAARDAAAALRGAAAAAFSVQGETGEVLVLLQEVPPDQLGTLDAERLTGEIIRGIHASFGLAPYDLVLVRAGTLPRTTSGKIQRYLCREAYLGGKLANLGSAPHPALGRARARI